MEPVIIHQEVSPNGNCFCPAHSLFISLDGSGSERLRSKQTVSLVLLFISLSLRTGMRQISGLFNFPLSYFHLFFCGIDKTPQPHSCWSHTIIRNVCIDQVPRKGSAFHKWGEKMCLGGARGRASSWMWQATLCGTKHLRTRAWKQLQGRRSSQLWPILHLVFNSDGTEEWKTSNWHVNLAKKVRRRTSWEGCLSVSLQE